MIKFYRQNKWREEGGVRTIPIINVSVIHCRCGCGEWSLLILIMGFGSFVTYNKNFGQ